MTNHDADSSPLYEVRVTEPAEVEIESAYLGRMQFGLEAADRWYAGLARALESLSQWPRRFPIVPEREALGDVRQMIYGKGRNAYRILYRVFEPQDGEPGIVRILHIRHAARQHLGQTGEAEEQDAS